MAKWVYRPVRRASRRSRYAEESNPLTSAAIWHSCADGSYAVMRPTPDRPATRPANIESQSFPTGETAPMPVTTTHLGSGVIRRTLPRPVWRAPDGGLGTWLVGKFSTSPSFDPSDRQVKWSSDEVRSDPLPGHPSSADTAPLFFGAALRASRR